MSLIKSIRAQLGLSVTPANNFTLDASANDGTMKLARGNAGSGSQDILTVDAAGLVSFPQGRQLTLATAQATTSGTSIDFTGIPSWAKRITVMFSGVSTSVPGHYQLQLGTSGGVQTTGYDCQHDYSSGPGANATTGFVWFNDVASDTYRGQIVLSLFDSATGAWTCSGNLGMSRGDVMLIAGSKVLSGVLDRVRLTTVAGSTNFDAGSINIMYEG